MDWLVPFAAICLLALVLYLPWAFGKLHGEARIARRHREFLMEELSKFASDFSAGRVTITSIHDNLVDVRSTTQATAEAIRAVDDIFTELPTRGALRLWHDQNTALLQSIEEHLGKQEPKLMPIPAPEAQIVSAPANQFDPGDSVYRALKLMGDRVRAAEADREKAIQIAKALKERLDAQAKPTEPYPVVEPYEAGEVDATIQFDEPEQSTTVPTPRRGMTSPFDDILKAAKPKDDE